MSLQYILKSANLVGTFSHPSLRELARVTEVEGFEWGVGRLLNRDSGKIAAKPVAQMLSVSIVAGESVSGQLGRLMTAGTRMASLEILGFRNDPTHIPLRYTFSDVGVEALDSDTTVNGVVVESWAFSYRRLRMSFAPLNANGGLGTPVVGEFAPSNF